MSAAAFACLKGVSFFPHEMLFCPFPLLLPPRAKKKWEIGGRFPTAPSSYGRRGREEKEREAEFVICPGIKRVEEGEFFFKVEEKEEGFIENHSWARKSFFASPPPCTLPSNGAKNNLSPPISKKDPLGQVRDREK